MLRCNDRSSVYLILQFSPHLPTINYSHAPLKNYFNATLQFDLTGIPTSLFSVKKSSLRLVCNHDRFIQGAHSSSWSRVHILIYEPQATICFRHYPSRK